jgi:hypothetical protein
MDERSKEDDEEAEDQRTIAEHYGWLHTLYNLAKSSVLSVTGDKSLLELNVIFVFNWISLDYEIEKQKQDQLKKQQQRWKN